MRVLRCQVVYIWLESDCIPDRPPYNHEGRSPGAGMPTLPSGDEIQDATYIFFGYLAVNGVPQTISPSLR
jgi:hypothetical protein